MLIINVDDQIKKKTMNETIDLIWQVALAIQVYRDIDDEQAKQDVAIGKSVARQYVDWTRLSER